MISTIQLVIIKPLVKGPLKATRFLSKFLGKCIALLTFKLVYGVFYIVIKTPYKIMKKN